MSTANNNAKSQQEILQARKAVEAAEKAEFMQAVMSLYIPLSLFVACCIFAAGVFMVYYEEPIGWGFIATTTVIALSAFWALFKFQNKFRARGIIPTKDTIVESNVVDASPVTDSKEILVQIAAPGLNAKSYVEEDCNQGSVDTSGDVGQPGAAPARSGNQVASAK